VEVIGHQPGSWYLLREGERHFLDVACSVSIVSFAMLVELDEDERADLHALGHPYVTGLAKKINDWSSRYRDRDNPDGLRADVYRTIMAWRDSTGDRADRVLTVRPNPGGRRPDRLGWAALDRRARNDDLAGVTAMLLAADERERLALADEVESRLTGMTAGDRASARFDPAGGYVLAVIGSMPSADRAAALLRRRELRAGWAAGPAAGALAIVRARALPWVGDLAVRLAERISPRDPNGAQWEFVSTLLGEARVAPPVTKGVVRGWLHSFGTRGDGPLTTRLRHSPYLDLLLSSVFTVDGVGDVMRTPCYDPGSGSWEEYPAALAHLAAEGRLDRGVLLDATVRRLVRGDRGTTIHPFAELHEALEPTVDELAGYTHDYVRLLSTAPLRVAGLAQRALHRLDRAGRLDLDTLLAASVPVLARTEKALAGAQLDWLAEIADREPARRGEVLGAVAAAAHHPVAGIRRRALAMIGAPGR
jgi:hypothetical protein